MARTMIQNDKCKSIECCIACGNVDLTEILDLKTQPLANSFKKTKEEKQDEYPLKLNKCKNCHHLQLSHMVHPDELFKNYIYVSGTSKTQLEYFDWFSRLVNNKVSKNNAKILDIGCNDGSQLNYFKQLNFITNGIDPAENLYEYSSKNHNIICDYFNIASFPSDKKYDVIICQNAFAHNFNQLQFLQKCKELLEDNGFIFITISQANMILNNEFDTIYHEHYSYYNTNSMKILCERAELHLSEVIEHPIHGTSYIFVITKNKQINNDNIIKKINEEKNAGLYEDSLYQKYALNAELISKQFKNKIDQLKSQNYIIIGYGSPAKGNTFLNFCKTKLDFIIDDNPLKQNMFTPGTSIPIYSIDYLNTQENNKICFVPLAWNFFDEIVKKIKTKRLNKNDLYLKYFPEVKFNEIV